MAIPANAKSGPAARRIVAAARSHFLSHGFRAVTMDDLAGEMGMSKKTLYQYFGTKRDLLCEVIVGKIDEFGAAMDAIPAGPEVDFSESLRRLLECVQENLREVGASFIRDLAKADPEYFQLIQERRREVITRCFGRILRVGQAGGGIRSDIPAELLIDILLASVDAVLTPRSLVERGKLPRDLLDPVLKVFLEGVRVSTIK